MIIGSYLITTYEFYLSRQIQESRYQLKFYNSLLEGFAKPGIWILLSNGILN